MTERRTPSYIPPDPTLRINQDLFEEEKVYSFDPELVLDPELAKEFLEADQLMEQLFQNCYFEQRGLRVGPKIYGRDAMKGHGKRVSIRSLSIYQELQKRREALAVDVRALTYGALFHDIGKFKPEIHCVVMFPGKIAPDCPLSWPIIKQHPRVGHDVTLDMPGLSEQERRRIAQVILYHHERQDGQGYEYKHPSEIPFESQIITVADAMDVITGKRPYQERRTSLEAIAELERCPNQFNQNIVAAVKRTLPSSGEIIQYWN